MADIATCDGLLIIKSYRDIQKAWRLFVVRRKEKGQFGSRER